MSEPLLGAALVAGVLAPHVLRLDRVSPTTGATIWMLALLLRALVVLGIALFLVADLHSIHGAASVFAIGDWHPQHALAAVSAMFDIATHPMAHVLVLLPILVIAGGLVAFAAGLVRGVGLLRRLMQSAVGEGPHGSTVVRDPRIVVAVAGVGRGRILLSDTALAALDPDELAAGIAHERGHVRRGHRPLLLLASLLAAVAWAIPGTRSAHRRLIASLECDADDYAVRATGDRLALASAICKAASTAPVAATSLRGPGPVVLRLERLVDEGQRASPVLERASLSLALLLLVMTAIVVELLVSLILFVPDPAHLMTLAGLPGDH